LYVANAFSLQMLDSFPATVEVEEVSLDEARALLTSNEFVSAVGHGGTAEVLSALLGVDVPENRVSIRVGDEDAVLVFQLLTRLEEGRVLSGEELRALPYRFFVVRRV